MLGYILILHILVKLMYTPIFTTLQFELNTTQKNLPYPIALLIFSCYK